MKKPRSIAFRAARVLVITAVAFAVIVIVHRHRQAAVKPSSRVVALAQGAALAPLLAGTPVALVSFGADGCGSCQALKPLLHQLADAHPKTLSVILVDVGAHAALALESGVKAVPDTRLYVGGKLVDGRTGAQTRETLDEWLRPHIVSAAYSHSHDHDGHDHEGHDHHGHDHEGHDHHGHDHHGHDHEGDERK
jgi:thiol-disulfide isomerase/thioredoxin